jgi:hypothetical protein
MPRTILLLAFLAAFGCSPVANRHEPSPTPAQQAYAFDESDPKAQAINMAWDAARTKYPDIGGVADYRISVAGAPDDFMTIYFYLATAGEPIPTVVVNVRNGRVTDVFRMETIVE